MWFLSPLTMLPLLAYTRFAWSTVTIDPFTYTLTADPASTSTDAEAVAATPTSVDPSIVSNKTAPVETQSVVETSESPEYTGTATAIPTTLPAANASATFAPAFAPSDTAAVEDQDYEDVLGTNRNAPSAGEGQLIGFNFVSDAKQKMGDRTALPKLLIQKANVCHYDWARIKTPPSFTVFRDESLSVDDVSQGGVGDCGLGASVIAITASKRTKYLRRLTRIGNDSPSVGLRTYRFLFRQRVNAASNPTIQTVLIDDKLPFDDGTHTASTKKPCRKLLGFQPTLKTPSLKQNSPVIYFMPLLEKAWAKYLDVFPNLKSAKNKNLDGFGGIEGTPANNALAALTGGIGHRIDKVLGENNNQAAITAAVKKCVVDKTPCVIGTPPGNNLKVLGPLDQLGVFYAGTSPTYHGAIHDLDDRPGVPNPSFLVYDYNRINKVTGDIPQFALVSDHAYAIDPSQSYWDNTSPRKGYVTIINPWGCQPTPTGYCDPENPLPKSIRISAGLFVRMVETVYSVSNLPGAL